MDVGYFYHDSRRLRYRTPFGAAKRGEAIYIAADFQGSERAALRLWVDGHEELIYGQSLQNQVQFTFTPASTGLVWYYFILDSPRGRRYYGVERGTGGKGQFSDTPPCSWQITVYDPGFETPRWFREGIVYQVFPDRFCRKEPILGIEAHQALEHRIFVHDSWEERPNYQPLPGDAYYDPCDFFGGNLAGIRDKLPYLVSLGVTCIYLNPIFLSSSNHRYNTADYLRIDPMLGTEEDLLALIREARAHGIRLMLDGVFSHTGADSVYFDRNGTFGNGAYSNPGSPYRAWYDFTQYPSQYRCWWGFASLPEVKELEPTYMDFVSGILARYGALGIANWRLDVADELPDAFIAYLREKLKAIDPDGVLLGEVWDDASNKEGFGARRKYVDGAELDSAMGYPFKDAVLDFLIGKASATEFVDRLTGLRENYPLPFYNAQLNILGSHDTIRALTVLAGAPHRDALSREEQAAWQPTEEALVFAKARLRLGAVLQFSLPGVPCIYYGDEAGMAGMADPFNRGTYPWGKEDQELLEFYRTLSAARRGCSALYQGKCAFAALTPDVFAALRCEGAQGAICLVNRSAQSYCAVLNLDRFQEGPDVGQVWIDGRYVDILTGREYVAEHGALCIELGPVQGMLLIRLG